MDYEKKYKEALVNMQELYNSMKYMSSTDALHTTMYLEKAFPELKESEDEKIRKEILEYFQQFENEELRGVNISDWIAWLEKQKTSEEALQYLKENHSSSELSDFQAAMNISTAKAYDKGYNDALEKQGESKFEQCIQEGDNIVTNEDGTHFNVSQLERVSQKVTNTKETAKKFLKTAGIMDKNKEQLAEEYMQEKSFKFHIGDTVKIHCCERPKHIQDIYNNKLGNIDCIWDLNKNPWGNIGVKLENGCNNLFYESELELVAKKE